MVCATAYVATSVAVALSHGSARNPRQHVGALNVTVSFYLAFSLALRAQNVSGVDRSHIYAAIRARLRTAPLSFFMPERRKAA